jgi:hypothetical protein
VEKIPEDPLRPPDAPSLKAVAALLRGLSDAALLEILEEDPALAAALARIFGPQEGRCRNDETRD